MERDGERVDGSVVASSQSAQLGLPMAIGGVEPASLSMSHKECNFALKSGLPGKNHERFFLSFRCDHGVIPGKIFLFGARQMEQKIILR